MKITIELDVNLKLDELEDFIGELSEDITNGDTAKSYTISVDSWDWREE